MTGVRLPNALSFFRMVTPFRGQHHAHNGGIVRVLLRHLRALASIVRGIHCIAAAPQGEHDGLAEAEGIFGDKDAHGESPSVTPPLQNRESGSGMMAGNDDAKMMSMQRCTTWHAEIRFRNGKISSSQSLA